MHEIFISYRRSSDQQITGRVGDRLRTTLGVKSTFIDTGIPYGVDFHSYLDSVLDRSKVLVAMIGANWSAGFQNITPSNPDRIDYVHFELSNALTRNIPILPVLVDGAKMPPAEQLPEDIRRLARYQALEMWSGIDFDTHYQRLYRAIADIIKPLATIEVQFELSEGSTRGININSGPGGSIQEFKSPECCFHFEVPIGERKFFAVLTWTQVGRIAGTNYENERGSTSPSMTRMLQMSRYRIRVVRPERGFWGSLYDLISPSVEMEMRFEELP